MSPQQEEDPRPAARRRRVTLTARWQDAARQQNPDAGDDEIRRAAEELRDTYYSERSRRAIGVRLAREDPSAMTAAARASSRHVKSLARWEQAAREQHPRADDEKIAVVAAELRSAFYSEIGRRSGEVRRRRRAGAPSE